jgi:hypothetical protein
MERKGFPEGLRNQAFPSLQSTVKKDWVLAARGAAGKGKRVKNSKRATAFLISSLRLIHILVGPV